ncbi:hypothetical protein [Streptomyces sp. NPDC055105]|uniref:hypothetical protein n=1 Tax=Streptomyces sp. NPDC055105 TaxID=3365719 RepID=UPI0037D58749
MDNLPYVISHFRGSQRVFLVIVGIIPLLLLTVAALPSVLILPFWGTRGLQRAEVLIQKLTAWLRVLLRDSRHAQH